VTATPGPPLVSVAITTFNVAPFLNEALAGISAQDYRPLEVVAYDDASTDSSKDLLEAFRESVDFPVTLLHGSVNRGPYYSLKQALSACAGTYVAILDGDDIWLPGKVTAQVAWFERDASRVLCGHDVECFESDTGEVLWTAGGQRLLQTGSGAARSVRNGPLFPTSAIMLRRAAVPRNWNPYDLSGYKDWNLWSDCLAAGGGYGYVSGMYSRYRRNPAGTVARNARNVDASMRQLKAGLVWLGEFEALHPEWHAECRFRRATLLANHGRLVFELGHADTARAYARAALPDYGRQLWKGAGMMVIASLPLPVANRVYSVANRVRMASRRFIAPLRRRQ
jgi:glycosyltransferase involved in cell wall biosynthesis